MNVPINANKYSHDDKIKAARLVGGQLNFKKPVIVSQ